MSARHGEATRGATAEYRCWAHIKSRCHDPGDTKYPRYGGRGIKVCERWRYSYETFLADMGRRPSAEHSIDRIDNDGDYEPGNCRWATRSEQCRNRSQNVFVMYEGKRMCLTDACKAKGVRFQTIGRRIFEGATPQDAFDRPLNPKKSAAGLVSARRQWNGEDIMKRPMMKVQPMAATTAIERAKNCAAFLLAHGLLSSTEAAHVSKRIQKSIDTWNARPRDVTDWADAPEVLKIRTE